MPLEKFPILVTWTFTINAKAIFFTTNQSFKVWSIMNSQLFSLLHCFQCFYYNNPFLLINHIKFTVWYAGMAERNSKTRVFYSNYYYIVLDREVITRNFVRTSGCEKPIILTDGHTSGNIFLGSENIILFWNANCFQITLS